MKALRDLQEVHISNQIQLTQNPGLVSSTRCIRWLQFPGHTLSMRFLVQPIACGGLQPARGETLRRVMSVVMSFLRSLGYCKSYTVVVDMISSESIQTMALTFFDINTSYISYVLPAGFQPSPFFNDAANPV